MNTIKDIFNSFRYQVEDLLKYNKAATITVALVSFAVGAIIF